MTMITAAEHASRVLGLSLGDGIALIAAAATVLTLLVGEGILLRIGNVFSRRYEWEVGPVRDPATRAVQARVSQGYGDNRVLSKAYVAVVPSLLLRIVWLVTHFHKVDRFVIAATLLEPNNTLTLTSNAGVNLTGKLKETVPMPTWKLWKKNPQSPDPTTKRLVMILKLDRRRRLLSKKVDEAPGSFQPLSAESVPVAHPADAAEAAKLREKAVAADNVSAKAVKPTKRSKKAEEPATPVAAPEDLGSSPPS
jgi:hypothetical protein